MPVYNVAKTAVSRYIIAVTFLRFRVGCFFFLFVFSPWCLCQSTSKCLREHAVLALLLWYCAVENVHSNFPSNSNGFSIFISKLFIRCVSSLVYGLFSHCAHLYLLGVCILLRISWSFYFGSHELTFRMYSGMWFCVRVCVCWDRKSFGRKVAIAVYTIRHFIVGLQTNIHLTFIVAHFNRMSMAVNSSVRSISSTL